MSGRRHLGNTTAVGLRTGCPSLLSPQSALSEKAGGAPRGQGRLLTECGRQTWVQIPPCRRLAMRLWMNLFTSLCF